MIAISQYWYELCRSNSYTLVLHAESLWFYSGLVSHLKTESSSPNIPIYVVNSLHVVANNLWNKCLTCIKGSAGPIVEKITIQLLDQLPVTLFIWAKHKVSFVTRFTKSGLIHAQFQVSLFTVIRQVQQ